MSGLFHHERLEPSLLDRLTSDDTQPGMSAQEAFDQGGDGTNSNTQADAPADNQVPAPVEAGGTDRLYISTRRLREIVKRDLAWLLNTGNLDSVEDLGRYPLVAQSVLNYGISELTGKSVANADVFELERVLRRAIIQYEPRILPKSLRITVKSSGQMAQNALGFEIECDIWSQPSPEHMHLDLQLDLDTGAVGFRGDY